jgi:hypothetical protein
MDDTDRLLDAANLMPRITGAINNLRSYAFTLSNYIDDYRRGGSQVPDTMKYMAERLIETTDYLGDELRVVKEVLSLSHRQT